MKKIIAVMLTAMLAVSACACGSNQETSSSNNNVSQTEDNSSKSENDNQYIDISNSQNTDGFAFSLPKGVHTGTSYYGYTFEYGDFCILLDDVADLTEENKDITVEDSESVVSICQETLFDSIRSENRDLFDYGATEQEITSKENVSYNGIDMLKVKGNLLNTSKNTTIPYIAYYFIRYDSPKYVIGINRECKDDPELEKFMDELISNVRPEED